MNKKLLSLLLITPFLNTQIKTTPKAIIIGPIKDNLNMKGAPGSSSNSSSSATSIPQSSKQLASTSTSNQTPASTTLLLPTALKSTSANTSSSSKKNPKAPANKPFTGTFYNNTGAVLYITNDNATITKIAKSKSLSVKFINNTNISITQNTSGGPWTEIAPDGTIFNFDSSGTSIPAKQISGARGATNLYITLDSATPANLIISTTSPSEENSSTKATTTKSTATPTTNTTITTPTTKSAATPPSEEKPSTKSTTPTNNTTITTPAAKPTTTLPSEKKPSTKSTTPKSTITKQTNTTITTPAAKSATPSDTSTKPITTPAPSQSPAPSTQKVAASSANKPTEAQALSFTGNFYNNTGKVLYISNGTNILEITAKQQTLKTLKTGAFAASGNPITLSCMQDSQGIQISASTSEASPITQINFSSASPENITVQNYDQSKSLLTKLTKTIPVTNSSTNLYLSLDSAGNILVGATAPQASTKTTSNTSSTSSNNNQSSTNAAQQAAAQQAAAQQAAAQQAAAQQAAAQQAAAQQAAIPTVPFSTFLYNSTDHDYNNFNNPSNNAIFLYASDDTGTQKGLLNNSAGTNVWGVGPVNKIYVYKNASYSGPCVMIYAPQNGTINVIECDANKKPVGAPYTLSYNYGPYSYMGQTQAPNIAVFNNPNSSSISGLIVKLG